MLRGKNGIFSGVPNVQVSFLVGYHVFLDIFFREVFLLVCTENKHHSQPIS